MLYQEIVKLSRCTRAAAFLSATFLLSCSMNIFESTNDKPLTASGHSPNQDEILLVEVSGGFAGVKQTLRIFPDGYALVEGYPPYQEKRSQLSAEEMEGLKSTFFTNDFLSLKSKYFDTKVADAFYYEIRYDDGLSNNTVNTNNFNAPDNLNRVVEEIHRLIDRVVNDGLAFDLTTDKQVLKKGESVAMTLTLTNTSSKTLTLVFNDAQIYDFVIKKRAAADQDSLVWNWAHDRLFAQALASLTLNPKEKHAYTQAWSGQDNHGNPVHGTVLLNAELVSTPGGSTRQVEITVE
jgi:hypothetical protein